MEKDGEASCFPDLRQDGLCIVSVGRASQKNGECAADELLRQLMTLPRPVCVGFARTASTAIVQAVPVESPQKASITKRDPAPRCARFSALGPPGERTTEFVSGRTRAQHSIDSTAVNMCALRVSLQQIVAMNRVFFGSFLGAKNNKR